MKLKNDGSISFSILNNHDGTWTARVSVTVPETREYYKADLVTSKDYEVCARLFNVNFAEQTPNDAG